MEFTGRLSGLTDLAEGGNEVWEMARNQEIAGRFSKEQGLSKVVGVDGQHATQSATQSHSLSQSANQGHSLKVPGPGGNLWPPSPGSHAQPWVQME